MIHQLVLSLETSLYPEKTRKAENALVFMFAGLKGKWKQVVALYYTSKKMEGSFLKPIT